MGDEERWWRWRRKVMAVEEKWGSGAGERGGRETLVNILIEFNLR